MKFGDNCVRLLELLVLEGQLIYEPILFAFPCRCGRLVWGRGWTFWRLRRAALWAAFPQPAIASPAGMFSDILQFLLCFGRLPGAWSGCP